MNLIHLQEHVSRKFQIFYRSNKMSCHIPAHCKILHVSDMVYVSVLEVSRQFSTRFCDTVTRLVKVNALHSK